VSPFLLGPMVRMRLGRPELGRLTINLRTWERLKAASQGTTAPLTAVTMKRIERGLFLQWLFASLLIGTIFSFIVQSESSAVDTTSIALCFGFPAIVLGLNQIVRYLIQMR